MTLLMSRARKVRPSVEGFEHPRRPADPSAGTHRQDLAVDLEHVDRAYADDLAARHRRDRRPVHAAVMADIERLPVGHPRKIAGADIAEKAGLLVDEFQRPHIGALLGPDSRPVPRRRRRCDRSGPVPLPYHPVRASAKAIASCLLFSV